MLKKDITPEESVKENIETWCFEVGSRFEQASIDAAEDFHRYAFYKDVVDLGSGDGAATRQLVHLDYFVDAVDPNFNKLGMLRDIDGVMVYGVSARYYLEHIGRYVFNVFSHHSLEHMVDASSVIWLAGQRMIPGGIWYAVVPAGDYLHSVHHVVFESPEELLPEGLEPILLGEQTRHGEKEFICVAGKK